MNANDLREDIASELELLEETVKQIRDELDSLGEGEPTAFQRAGFGALLMNFYSGVENILKRISQYEGIEVPRGPRWHVDLFNRFREPVSQGREPLLDETMAGPLKPYRDFRHVMVHGYGVALRWPLMRDVVFQVGETLEAFRRRITEYLDTLDET